jgi:histidinol-phosphate aminotransferase
VSPLSRRLLRPEMKDVAAYATSTASAPVRLDRNESPEEMTPQTREKVLDALSSARWSRYTDPYAAELKTVLAERDGLAPESVIVGNGSNSLFLSFFLAAGIPGRRFGLCPPTFGLYAPWVRAAGCRVADFPLGEDDLAPPVNAMLSAAREDPDLAFVLCSPNNPTGTLFPREGLVSILETGALVVVDEAYVEFSGRSARDLLPRFSNLVLSRTLSKASALAGARIGYMLGSPEILSDIEKVLPPYGVNLFARAAALAALEEEAGMRARVESILAERGRMARILERMPGARLSASHTNFLYLRPERPAGELFEALLSRGILVRRVAGTRTGALRVTVGRPEENDRFLDAWKEVTS